MQRDVSAMQVGGASVSVSASVGAGVSVSARWRYVAAAAGGLGQVGKLVLCLGSWVARKIILLLSAFNVQ